jgi:hypothetical protein
LPTFEGTFAVLDYRWLKERHLKLRLGMENGQSLDAIAFNAIDRFEFDPMQMQVRLVYQLEKYVQWRNQFAVAYHSFRTVKNRSFERFFIHFLS